MQFTNLRHGHACQFGLHLQHVVPRHQRCKVEHVARSPHPLILTLETIPITCLVAQGGHHNRYADTQPLTVIDTESLWRLHHRIAIDAELGEMNIECRTLNVER